MLGLHMLADDAEYGGEAAIRLRQTFDTLCREAGVAGEITLSTGTIAHEVAARAERADLLVARLNHPPGARPREELRSGLRTLLVRAPCPVLTVLARTFPARHTVLAHDGSPKAREAIFVAAYLPCRWPDLELMMVCAHQNLAL